MGYRIQWGAGRKLWAGQFLNQPMTVLLFSGNMVWGLRVGVGEMGFKKLS